VKKKKSRKPTPIPSKEVINKRVITGTSQSTGKYPGLIIAAFAFLLYAQSISFGYVLDDETSIAKNHLVQEGVRAIPTLLVTDFWHGSDVGVKIPIYRPGSSILFATLWQLFPDSPAVYHFVIIVLYALTCWLLFLLLTTILQGWNILFPFCCVILYAAHPIHTEVVNNIKSADEILCFLFAILASLAALRDVQRRTSLNLIWMALCFFFSILCKETGIVFVLVIPMMLYFFTDAEKKKMVTVFGVLVVMLVPWFLLRNYALQHVPVYEHSPLVNSLYATTDFISQRATAFFILLKYEWLLVFPHPLSYDYDYNQIPIRTLTNPWVLVAILLQLGLVVFAILGVGKKHFLAFSILCFFIMMAPIANIFLIIGTILGERLLFTPSLCFVLALTYGLFRWSKTETHSAVPLSLKAFTSSGPVLLIGVGLITSLYVVKTITRSQDWKSNVTLFGHDVKVTPGSATAQYHWGNALLSQLYAQEENAQKKSEYLQEAIAAYNTALDIYPDYTDAIVHLGDAYNKNGEPAKAIPLLARYNELMNYSKPDMIHYLALVYDQAGQQDEGIAAFQTILKNNAASDPEVWYSLGMLYNKKQDYDQALPYLDSCLRYNPDHQLALTHKIIADLNLQRNEEAVTTCDKLISLDPNNQKVYTYLGVACANLGNYPKSMEAFEKAVQLDPGDEESKQRLNVLKQFLQGKSQ
jgi:tetratricopeptide (TPR) repeat protein